MTTNPGPADPYDTGNTRAATDPTGSRVTEAGGDGVGGDGTTPNAEGIPPNEHADWTPGGDGPLDHQAAEKAKLERTRVAGTWVSLTLGAIIVLVLLFFIVQNNVSTEFQIFGFEFSLPLGVAVLASALLGALLMALVGGIRIFQLRRAYKKV